MGKTLRKEERLTATVQVPMTTRDLKRLKAHPLVTRGFTDVAPLCRVWILEKLDEEEKNYRK
jgi:hypothetical protein